MSGRIWIPGEEEVDDASLNYLVLERPCICFDSVERNDIAQLGNNLGIPRILDHSWNFMAWRLN